ncbi:type II toxin-antitoxin system PemK/MazF family toxin [Actinocatenispora sera]|uniref:type II toxin-antitoxin system PemK/MazF family toxin n=1 Tax=Actinocatenispora sera TaxID=390989 RepID=UPI0033C80A73
MPYPENAPRRGEIYWFEWNPSRGSEQRGRRPAVVISPDMRNARMPTLVIAALTTNTTRVGSAISVYLPQGRPLDKEGTILAFQVMTASKERLLNYAGCLGSDQLRELDRALKVAFGLE